MSDNSGPHVKLPKRRGVRTVSEQGNSFLRRRFGSAGGSTTKAINQLAGSAATQRERKSLRGRKGPEVREQVGLSSLGPGPNTDSRPDERGETRGGGGGGGGSKKGGGRLDRGLDDDLSGAIRAGLSKGDRTLGKSFSKKQKRLDKRTEGARGKLSRLDKGTRKDFKQQQKAEIALSQRGFTNRSDSLLTRLFGQGGERSSTAGTLGGRLIGDQGLVDQQIRSGVAGRRLSARQALTEIGQRNLELQGSNLTSGRNARLAEMGINSQAELGRLNAASGLKASLESTRGSLAGAQASAGAQRFSASQAAGASRFGSRLAADAQNFSTTSNFNLGQDRLRVGSNDILNQEAGANFRAGTAADASNFNALAGLEGSRFNTAAGAFTNLSGQDANNQQFDARMSNNMNQFANQLTDRERQRAQEALLTREGFQNNLDVTRAGGASSSDKLLSAAGGIIGGISGFF